MALKERIEADTKAALLGGNRFVGELLRNLKAAILNEEVAAGKRDEGLDDNEIEKIIAREVKKRAESARMYRENNRDDLADIEEKEAEVLQTYLPMALNDDDVRGMVLMKLHDMGDVDPSRMGEVIRDIKQAAGSGTDGAMIARIVKQELNK